MSLGIDGLGHVDPPTAVACADAGEGVIVAAHPRADHGRVVGKSRAFVGDAIDVLSAVPDDLPSDVYSSRPFESSADARYCCTNSPD
jgi:hypothetical protein